MIKTLFSFMSFRKLAGNRRLFLLCILLFCVSAMISFGWFFPADIVQRRLVQQVVEKTGLQVEGYNAEMIFPLGLQLDLYLEPELEELADIELKALKITPSWRSLLGDNPGAYFNGLLAQGELSALVERDGQLDLSLRGVDLSGLQNRVNDYLIGGVLSGQFKAENMTADFQGQGSFATDLGQTRIDGLEKIGLPADLYLGAVQIAGKFIQRRISFERILATEGVMELSGGGTLFVGETPSLTRLNLNLRLHPTQKTPESLRSMIQLTGVRPTTDGSYLLRIGGTLAKPVVR